MSDEQMPHVTLTYAGALEAAGAVVHAYEEFGSYQGDWWALVTYNGERGWVNGGFGSCSGCDSLQGEFEYNFGEPYEWDADYRERRPKSPEKIAEEIARFADFGRSYLEDALIGQDEAERKASENLEWDMDAKVMLDFIQCNRAEDTE